MLEIKDLHVSFKTYLGTVRALRGVSLSIAPGEVLAIVGESGCGKSVTAQAILRLLDQNSSIERGSIWFKQENILLKTEREMQSIRGKEIGIVFQDPMTSLNPTMRIGTQLLEGIYQHKKISRDQGKKIALQMLEAVGISDPARRFYQYPHEFSGGMRQRVVIAIALICSPSLLIADEPTTALDATVQAQILDLMRQLQKSCQMGILLITHDLGVVAKMCDRVVVMYGGQVMESGSVEQIFYQPRHPYTKALLRSTPKLGRANEPLHPIEGAPPNLLYPPTGCPFSARCHWAMNICSRCPSMESVGKHHTAACWLYHAEASSQLKQFEKI